MVYLVIKLHTAAAERAQRLAYGERVQFREVSSLGTLDQEALPRPRQYFKRVPDDFGVAALRRDYLGEFFQRQTVVEGAFGNFRPLLRVFRDGGDGEHQSTERHAEFPRIGGAASAQDLHRLKDLGGVAHPFAKRLFHVGYRGDGAFAKFFRHLDKVFRKRRGGLTVFHKGSAAAFHVKDVAEGAARKFFADDARGDELRGGNGPRHVAQLVEASLRGGQLL